MPPTDLLPFKTAIAPFASVGPLKCGHSLRGWPHPPQRKRSPYLFNRFFPLLVPLHAALNSLSPCHSLSFS